MSAEYTPTTGGILRCYAYDDLELELDSGRVVEFDRWLNQIKAAAWDEGHADGQHNEHEHRPGRKITNPYREDSHD